MHERGRNAVADMPRAVYEDALAFLRRSGVPEARLLGGEPTEHPAFCDYVELALERGFAVTVFSGGLMPAAALECLSRIPPSRLTVVLNAVEPGTEHVDWVREQERVCRRLGRAVELGVTLQSAACSPDRLLDWVRQYGLRQRVRLGVAHPIWGGANASLRLQSARRLGAALEVFVDRAQRAGVTVDLDCGFTPCMFSLRFLEEHAGLAAAIGSRCNPIVDILPEGTAIACYALSRFRRLPVTCHSTRDELTSRFDSELARWLPAGVSRDCDACDFRMDGRCGGGCRARRALRLRPDATRLLSSDAEAPR